jgi:hypothetical protein
MPLLTHSPSHQRGCPCPPAQEGSLELYLVECGVPPAEVDQVVATVVAWSFTRSGRPLIDRRRRLRVERNVTVVAEYLEQECGLALGECLCMCGCVWGGGGGCGRGAVEMQVSADIYVLYHAFIHDALGIARRMW